MYLGGWWGVSRLLEVGRLAAKGVSWTKSKLEEVRMTSVPGATIYATLVVICWHKRESYSESVRRVRGICVYHSPRKGRKFEGLNRMAIANCAVWSCVCVS